MKNFLYSIKRIVLTVFFVMVHLAVVSMLPYPWHAVNIAMALLILQIVRTEQGNIVWMGFLTGVLFDLYSTTTFGLYSFSFTFSCLFLYWLYTEIFTAQSLWAMTLIAVVGTILFRLLYIIGAYVSDTLLWSDILMYSGIEILLTTLLTIMLYGILGIYKYKKPMH